MSSYRKICPGMYEIPKDGLMRVPGLLVSSDKLLSLEGSERPIEQVKNVATLPGIVGHSIAMPDMHWGYGFPIGGVAAMGGNDAVVSPGGVGYDINCGVRVAILDLPFTSIPHATLEHISYELHRQIPKGAHRGSVLGRPLEASEWKAIERYGAGWALHAGYGFEEDLLHCESFGKLDNADMDAPSEKAFERGAEQIGSIGSGNHFVEIGVVENIFHSDIAATWGMKKGMLYVLIHSGSRGFGHQICHETVTSILKTQDVTRLVDRQLAFFPLGSSGARQYLHAMAMAANYAFANRQLLLHTIRKVLSHFLSVPTRSIRLLYDVAHNIAKFERHTVHGKQQELLVHRKGATRAFGPGHPELPPLFQTTGQPVLVPGDMARGSWILRGLGDANTFCSCCHGAGRMMSRHAVSRQMQSRNPYKEMEARGIIVKADSRDTVIEEMPEAYKDVDLVVESCATAKLADCIARLKPTIVLKG